MVGLLVDHDADLGGARQREGDAADGGQAELHPRLAGAARARQHLLHRQDERRQERGRSLRSPGALYLLGIIILI